MCVNLAIVSRGPHLVPTGNQTWELNIYLYVFFMGKSPINGGLSIGMVPEGFYMVRHLNEH